MEHIGLTRYLNDEAIHEPLISHSGRFYMGVAGLRRLKQLEEENRKLKGIVADLTLDKKMLQDVLSKKV
jgi:hypothetical protein